MSPSSRGLGHRPLTAVTGVRIPLGTPSYQALSCGVGTFGTFLELGFAPDPALSSSNSEYCSRDEPVADISSRPQIRSQDNVPVGALWREPPTTSGTGQWRLQ